MRLDTTTKEDAADMTQPSLCWRMLNSLLLCTGDMNQLDVYMQGTAATFICSINEYEGRLSKIELESYQDVQLHLTYIT